VTEINGEYFIDAPHTFKPDPSLKVSAPLYSKAKQVVKEALFDPAPQLIDPLILSVYKKLTRRDRRFLPKMQNILRSATRARAKLRPKTPRNLNFEFDHRHVPANLSQRDDIQWVDGKGVEQRFVICATTRQLNKLARAIRWE